jgi:tripartite-type tricarboxylate transporter receptor subunit TctC
MSKHHRTLKHVTHSCEAADVGARPDAPNRRRLLGMAAATIGVVALPARAQWPDRPIKLVVPFNAGAMGDNLARLITDELQARLGQPVVVENRGGAGGNIGAGAVARSAADGLTFLVAATNVVVINQFLYKDMGFDPLKVFDPVTFLVDVPSVVFSTARIPPKSFRELVAHAKANVGKLNYGSPGAGTTPHLAAELINRTHGLGMTHIPFRGAGPAIASLLAGETHMYLGGAGLGAQHVKAGTLRALAVSGETRLTAYPEIPTFAEAGLGDANSSNWWGIVAPAGTPADIRERFAVAVDQSMKTPKVAAVLDRLGVTAQTTGPQAMGQALPAQARMWAQFVSEANLTLQ